MPKLTIDILVEGMNRIDAIWEGIDPPSYAVTVRENGMLVLETNYKGAKKIRRFPSGESLYVGRSGECPIRIIGPPSKPLCVSRKQGFITHSDCWHYTPASKDNPTYLNDHALPPNSVARIDKDTMLGIGPMQRKPMRYAIALKLGVQ
jgi:hypothetical protein